MKKIGMMLHAFGFEQCSRVLIALHLCYFMRIDTDLQQEWKSMAMGSKGWRQFIAQYLLVLVSCLLAAGCGSDPYPSKAQIRINPAFKGEKVELDFKGNALFFKRELADDVKRYLREVKNLEDLENPKPLDLSFDIPQAKTLNKVRRTYFEKLKNFEALWEQYRRGQAKPLEDQITDLRKDLAQKMNRKKEVENYLKPETERVAAMEREIATVKGRIDQLSGQAIQALNETILGRELAVRKLSKNRASIFSYSALKTKKCQDASDWLVVWHDAADGICYKLRLPHRELKDTPGAEKFLELFKEALPLYKKLGALPLWRGKDTDNLHDRLQAAKKDLIKAKIRAENKYGQVMPLAFEIRKIEQKIKQLERKIPQLANDFNKNKFRKDNYQVLNEGLAKARGAYLDAVRKEITNKAFFSREVSLKEPFDMASGASYLWVRGELSGTRYGKLGAVDKAAFPLQIFVPLTRKFAKQDVLLIEDHEFFLLAPRAGDKLGSAGDHMARIAQLIDKYGPQPNT